MAQEGTFKKPGYPDTSIDVCREARQILIGIGDKWTILTLRLLNARSHRYNELRREIGTISQKVLTATLRNLERDGLVLRTVTPTTPPRVDYALTALGRDLLIPIDALAHWAFENHERVRNARAKFDLAAGKP